MLDALKKQLGITKIEAPVATPAVADAVTAAINVNVDSELTAQLETLKGEFATLQAAYASLETELASTKEALEAANVVVAQVEAAKAQAVADAKAVKMAARKAAVAESIGEAKADAFVLATETLDDAAFEVARTALAGSVAAEADTTLFKEVGVDAQADATKVGTESAEMKILKARFGVK